jgi:hypothetical protein
MKITVLNSKTKQSRRPGKTTVAGKAGRRSGRAITRILDLDVSKRTFTDDLTRIFKRNIAKARRENKKIFGSPDGV